jgi:hypothetical protein
MERAAYANCRGFDGRKLARLCPRQARCEHRYSSLLNESMKFGDGLKSERIVNSVRVGVGSFQQDLESVE